jgi:thermitase
MKLFKFNFIIFIVVCALLFPAGISASVESGASTIQGKILVKFNPSASASEISLIHRQNGAQVKEVIPQIGVQVITVSAGKVNEKVKAYRANSKVVFAEPDYIATADLSANDPYLSQQWGLTKVMAANAWDITTGNANVNIAILDTGVDSDHPDLAKKIVANKNFTLSTTVDDIAGHGTHVAGIAAAITNNGLGTAGLGYNSSIMNVKVLGDDGSGAYSWITNGIIWAADNGARVINMSLGGGSASSTLEAAINYAWSKGVVIVASAGNAGTSTPVYPGYYNNVISVAATDSYDRLTSWSTYGEWVDVAAPGSSIYSTLINNAYGYKSGTSMASPFVAGLAGLVFTCVTDTDGNSLLNNEVRAQIESSCDNISANISGGRINAYKAVQTTTPPVATGTITGKVNDSADGLPIAAANVTNGKGSTTTDPNGCYSFSNLSEGTYTITVSATDYTTKSQSVSVTADKTTTADFTLVKTSPSITTGSITGKVTNSADGLPIAAANVSNGKTSTQTDANGYYNFTNLSEGTYTVTVSATDYTTKSQSLSVTADKTTTADFALDTTTPKAPQPSANLWVNSMTLKMTGNILRLNVNVIGASGAVANAQVKVQITCTDGKLWSFSGVTDSSGNVSFSISKPASGTYTATIIDVIATNYTWDSSQGITTISYTISTPTNIKKIK